MYQVPTLNSLLERVRQSFRAFLPGSDAWVWPNNIYVTAKVLAGVGFEVMGFASYISRQKFAVTAPDIESLRLHGEEFGIPQKPASPATGKVAVTAAGPVAFEVGARLRRADGVEYLVRNGGSLVAAGSLSLSVVAAADGKVGNSAAGTPLAVISGVSGTAAVSVGEGGVAFGQDVEDIESYRARILFRKRNPPHGGAAADYVLWAGEVAGVSFDRDRPTVFVERRWAGPGTVRIFPLMFDIYDDGIPSEADVIRVKDHIEALCPAGTAVTVSRPIPNSIDVVVADLAPDRSDVREAVLAELRDAFRRLGRVAGIDSEIAGMPYLAHPTTFSRSWIWQAVANASGEDRHRIQAPEADIELSSSEYPVLGSVTFV